MLCRWRKLGRERQKKDLGSWGGLSAEEMRERCAGWVDGHGRTRTNMDEMPAKAGTIYGAPGTTNGMPAKAGTTNGPAKAGTTNVGKGGAWGRGFVFDQRRVDRVLTFLRKWLTFWEGEKAHQALVLERWQVEEIVAPLFGWVDAEGRRRFREAYIEVPRGNGKTTLIAALGTYLLVGDGEEGAQVWFAATKEEQAMIAFRSARNMVRRSPVLSKIIETPKTTLFFERTMSRAAALSGDAETADGLNPHAALVDELHKHPNRKMYDVLKTAMGKRRQPLMIITTTAGESREGICWEQHEYSAAILKGFSKDKKERAEAIEDDSFFVFMSSADEKDDWRDEKTWRKANPNYGRGLQVKQFQDDYTKACNSPAFLPSFKRDRLNLWTQAATTWLRMDHWRRCNVPPVEAVMRELDCYGGLDLSSTTDLTALALAWKVERGAVTSDQLSVTSGADVPHWGAALPERRGVEAWLLTHFWLPEEDIADREKRDKVPYRRWAAEGHLTLTPGNVVDYTLLEGEILQFCERYRVAEIAFDPYNATEITQRLENIHGVRMMRHRQGWASMTAPCRGFDKLVLEHALRHGNSPVLNWQAAHAAVKIGTGGEMSIVKPQRAGQVRIDGIVAAVMAVGRAMSGEGEGKVGGGVIVV